MTSPLPLPGRVRDVTASWLNAALAQRFPSTRVQDMAVTEVIWGTATKIRVTVRYSPDSPPDGPPHALCIKGGLDERWVTKPVKLLSRVVGADFSAAYLAEARFYDRMSTHAEVPLPRCYFAGTEADRQGIVILDDLVDLGVSFGDPTRSWPVDRVAAALEILAALHAATWGGTISDYPWLPTRPVLGDLLKIMVSYPYWTTHFLLPGAPELPDELDDRRRVRAAMEKLFAQHSTESRCLTHGDAHVGNTCVAPDGAPTFIDWQSVYPGPPLDDVAYFVTGALSVADRRGSERDLLAHYRSELIARGAPAPGADEVWNSYRRYALHGFGWVLCPPVMQPWRNVRAMSERHIAAILDLESIDAVHNWSP